MSIIGSNKGKTPNEFISNRKLDNILNDITDSSDSSKSPMRGGSQVRSNVESNVESKFESTGKTARYFKQATNHYDPKPKSKTRTTILPDILATETIEAMLHGIEEHLSLNDMSYIFTMNGGSNNTDSTMSTHSEPTIEPSIESIIEPTMTENINNSLVHEIDVLVDKITSE